MWWLILQCIVTLTVVKREEKKKEEDERMLGTAQLTALNISLHTILVSFSLVSNTDFSIVGNNKEPSSFDQKINTNIWHRIFMRAGWCCKISFMICKLQNWMLNFTASSDIHRRAEMIKLWIIFILAAAITNLSVSATKVNPGDVTIFTPSISTGKILPSKVHSYGNQL